MCTNTLVHINITKRKNLLVCICKICDLMRFKTFKNKFDTFFAIVKLKHIKQVMNFEVRFFEITIFVFHTNIYE